MKIIAFYLPQFHEIPENNDAWGNGFTEWVNVKKAQKYHLWQNQPRIPLNNNYYNLLDIDTMKWQADLANSSGIYGFCFYHYWFNGRLVLEKPVNNLLNNKDVNLKYCFSWANEPWTKTWHGAGGNKEILIPQTYGYQDEWERHYQYFQQFFRDERYIKENGKPILLIYRLRNIPDFNSMLKYWKQRAVQDGFEGLYVISMNVSREHVYMSKWVDGSVDFEPNRTKYELIQEHNRTIDLVLNYDDIYEKMIGIVHTKNHYRTAFVDYDDTPRRGNRGICTQNGSPDKFGIYFKRICDLSEKEGNEYVFINAWNEWGEGNYLEPDTVNEYRYIEEVKKITSKLK